MFLFLDIGMEETLIAELWFKNARSVAKARYGKSRKPLSQQLIESFNSKDRPRKIKVSASLEVLDNFVTIIIP